MTAAIRHSFQLKSAISPSVTNEMTPSNIYFTNIVFMASAIISVALNFKASTPSCLEPGERQPCHVGENQVFHWGGR